MSNDKPPPVNGVRQGSQTAGEIYISVGLALSWWEASEDILEKIFEVLCGRAEPVALKTFGVAPRVSRNMMILSALEHYPLRALPAEVAEIRAALKALDKLAPLRNEIAHGYVSEVTKTVDDILTMDGNFLTSTLRPSGEKTLRTLNYKYAHTAAEIDEWRDRVRAERGRILEVWFAIVQRDQDTEEVAQSRPENSAT